MSKKHIVLICILPVFIFVLLGISYLAYVGLPYLLIKNTGQIILVNDSNQSITHATVEICGQFIEIDNIKPKEEFKGTFKVKGDSHYKVTVTFSSGKIIIDEFGYVTDGFDYEVTITVTDSKIYISNSEAH